MNKLSSNDAAAKRTSNRTTSASDLPPRIVNAMTVDVEDYMHVSAFANQIRREDWDSLPSRVVRNTDLVLDLFQELGIHATFFVLGWVAERHPALVRRIAGAGHEVASHGCDHVRVHDQEPAEFRADIRRSKQLLEDVSGESVRGYRAASFSIGPDSSWAFPILADEGYAYSSSIYPIHHDLYGMPNAPRFAFRPATNDGVLEIPISTTPLLGRNLPCGGGGYFRVLPYRMSRWGMRRVNLTEGQPCIFYFHPWEIDPDQPKQAGVSFRSRFRHYTNLRRMESRLRRVATDFDWDRLDRVFALDQGFPI